MGVSFDQEYYGVHTMVPSHAMLLNSAMTAVDDSGALGPRAPNKLIATAMVGSMIHEVTHFREMNHSTRFISEMQRLAALLESADNFNLGNLKQEVRSILDRNHDIYSALNRAFRGENLSNRGVKLADGSSYSARNAGPADAVGGAGRAGQDDGRVAAPAGTGAGPAAAGGQRGAAGAAPAAAGGLASQAAFEAAVARREKHDASWTAGRIARLLSTYAYSHDEARTKAYAAWIRPQDYMALTTANPQRLGAEARPLDAAELARQTQELFLRVDGLAHGDRPRRAAPRAPP